VGFRAGQIQRSTCSFALVRYCSCAQPQFDFIELAVTRDKNDDSSCLTRPSCQRVGRRQCKSHTNVGVGRSENGSSVEAPLR